MTQAQSNHLNSFLIVFSALFAWHLPFELFLFAYAILGPLHYFTEISWLHDRKYFCQSKFQSIPLYLIATISFVFVILLKTPIDGVLFIGFGLAILSTLTTSRVHYGLLLLALIPLSQWLIRFDSLNIILVSLLPTLIHVCIFTLLFMLFGSLKSKSISGYVSVLIYFACAITVLIVPENNSYIVSSQSFDAASIFSPIANQLSTILGRDKIPEALISAFRFIAFAYTFHYLNWFIKVRTIGWLNISNTRVSIILFAWVCSIMVYLYDFRIGLASLFLFSLTHVLLEFPLNFQSIKGIAKELSLRLQ